MLSCCKSDQKPHRQPPQSPQKPHYKYSFKQRSHILITPQKHPYSSSIYQPPQPYPNKYPPPSPPLPTNSSSQQQILEQEYKRLARQKEQLENFMKFQVNGLEKQVRYYEGEIIHRQKEIQQLGELLDIVVKSRNNRYGGYGGYGKVGVGQVGGVQVGTRRYV